MGSSDAVVAVLAGGRGRRLGKAKPLAELGGRPLIFHVLAAARESGMPAVVVTKAAVPLPPLPCEVVIEPEAPVHPLCGLIAALQLAERRGHDGVVAVACDTPFVTGPLLAWLATHGERGRALVARMDGRLQPLLGRYPISQLAALQSALAEGCSLAGVATRLGAATVSEEQMACFGDPQRLCFNVNSADDLRVAHELLAPVLHTPASPPNQPGLTRRRPERPLPAAPAGGERSARRPSRPAARRSARTSGPQRPRA